MPILPKERFKEVSIMALKMTSIQVQVETKDRLKVLGIMGYTYDDIIQRLLDRLGKKSLKKD